MNAYKWNETPLELILMDSNPKIEFLSITILYSTVNIFRAAFILWKLIRVKISSSKDVNNKTVETTLFLSKPDCYPRFSHPTIVYVCGS